MAANLDQFLPNKIRKDYNFLNPQTEFVDIQYPPKKA